MGEHDKTHRIIWRIAVYFIAKPLTGYLVTLDRQGNDVKGQTRGRDKRKRTIDLRVGDEFFCHERWVRVVKIVAQDHRYLTAAEAKQHAAITDGDGYVYQLPPHKVVPLDASDTVGRHWVGPK